MEPKTKQKRLRPLDVTFLMPHKKKTDVSDIVLRFGEDELGPSPFFAPLEFPLM